jgi:excisionase family DNA binding protein
MADFSSTDMARLAAVATDYERRRESATARLIRRVIRRVQPSSDPERQDDTLSTTEAAQLLGVSDQTIRNWTDLKWLPAHRAHPLARRKIPAAAVRQVREFRAQLPGIPNAKRMSDEDAVALVARRRARKRSTAAVAGRSR